MYIAKGVLYVNISLLVLCLPAAAIGIVSYKNRHAQHSFLVQSEKTVLETTVNLSFLVVIGHL
jgi:hypothetical protein